MLGVLGGDQDSGDLDLVHETSQIKPPDCLLLSLLVYLLLFACLCLFCHGISLDLHKLNQ